MIRRRIVVGTLLAALFGLGWWVGRGRASGDLYSNLDTLIEVLHAIQSSYVDEIEPQPLIEGGMRGMLRELDPYSEYLTQREYENLRATLDEQFEGVGVLVDQHEGYPVVVTPLEDSPAWEAGLMPGDVITRIDDRVVMGLGLPEVGAKLRGAPGTRVKVTVIRVADGESRDVTIVRRRIVTRSVPYAFVMPQATGYVRLSSFSTRAAAELTAAIDTLRAAGARSLVIDLRSNPGGLVEQAVAATQQLVPEGSLVVYTRGRVASASHRWLAGRSRALPAWPIAVLVDGGSASAAEIMAGALQDLDRALIVGQNTFGKGTVQDVFPLRNREGALKLTTAHYYTASGRSLQRPRVVGPEDADDEQADESGPDSAAADSADLHPAFRTPAGRTVRGGGGVEPDLVVQPDSLPPVARALEERRVAFRFAAERTESAASSADARWADFREFARAQGIAGSDADFDRERATIERGLRRELARRSLGAAAAARLALADDPVYQRASEVLGRARAPRDVFALAAGHAPAAPGPGRKAR